MASVLKYGGSSLTKSTRRMRLRGHSGKIVQQTRELDDRRAPLALSLAPGVPRALS